jgi:hypothetical protein
VYESEGTSVIKFNEEEVVEDSRGRTKATFAEVFPQLSKGKRALVVLDIAATVLLFGGAVAVLLFDSDHDSTLGFVMLAASVVLFLVSPSRVLLRRSRSESTQPNRGS